MKRLFVSLFLKSQPTPPKRIVLDFDATDDPIHGGQEGRFFHGYYKCYCYLPLYFFCGRDLLLAKLRPANIDASAGAKEEVAFLVAQIRQSWPSVEIWLRADSGFCREELMAWCENNGVHYVFGLARNARLEAAIAGELAGAMPKPKKSANPNASSRNCATKCTRAGPGAPGRGEGGASLERSQSALYRHLASARSL